ncbi:MAG: DUF11 domain-containing protein [Anaerolineae bacterium]|nr:DUF11 domain-containing protein [Anaerolineae bacterium]
MSHLEFRALARGETALILDGIVVADDARPPNLVVATPGASAWVTVGQPLTADLAVNKTAAPDQVTAGNAVTYTLTVTNHGPDTVDVTISDTLSPITGYTEVHIPSACSGTEPIICALPALSGTETLTLVVTTSPVFSGDLSNQATIGPTDSAVADPQPSNNAASYTVVVQSGSDYYYLYLPLIIREASQAKSGGSAIQAIFAIIPIAFGVSMTFAAGGSQSLRHWTRKRVQRILSLMVLFSLIGTSVVPTAVEARPGLIERASQPTMSPTQSSEPESHLGTAVSSLAPVAQSRTPAVMASGIVTSAVQYWADLNNDRRVDAGDLSLMAGMWRCTAGDACYSTMYDFNQNATIDAHDLAWVGNEYDVTPPTLVIAQPANGTVIGGTEVQVSGAVDDAHAVTVTINGVLVPLAGPVFTANVPISGGNQSLDVVAVDALGQSTVESRLIGVDAEGPFITIHTPKHRQAVYTLRPILAISYTDFYLPGGTTRRAAGQRRVGGRALPRRRPGSACAHPVR